MAEIKINGVSIHYQIQGQGSESIVFAHGLLWSEQIFENQTQAFQDRYRCISLISGAKANPLYLVQVMTLKHCIRTLLGSLRLYAPVPAILSESQWAAWLDFALQLGSRH